jgi:hypothetical protein
MSVWCGGHADVMLFRAEEQYVNTEVLRFVHGGYSPLPDKHSLPTTSQQTNPPGPVLG